MNDYEVIKALRNLPAKWVHEETQYIRFGDDSLFVANPEFPPMRWVIATQVWIEFEIKTGPFLEN